MQAKTKKRKLSERRRVVKSEQEPAVSKKKPATSPKRKFVNDSKKRVNSSSIPTDVMKSKVRRDSNGHILPGSGSNGGGRPKGSLSGAKASELMQSVSRVHLERRKPKSKRKMISWLDYQVDKSYDDTSLAIAILARMYPALKSIEQVTLALDSMEAQEAADIRRELRERCKTEGTAK